MDSERFSRFGNALVNFLHSDRFLPQDLLRNLAVLVAEEDTQAFNKLSTLWDRKNQERKQAGDPVLDLKKPLLLTRGVDDSTAEDELSRFLPEEKIMINKDLFRRKLHDLDFSKTDLTREQALIEELHSESIGLSRDDTILYFNLLKINSLSQSRKTGTPSATSAEGLKNFVEALLETGERDWGLSPGNLSKLNGGKVIAKKAQEEFIFERLKAQKTNTKILGLLFGNKPNKFSNNLKALLGETASQRGETPEELLLYFATYTLFSVPSTEALEKLGIQASLLSFLTDKIGRVRSIYYVSILFSYTFFYVLITQVTEISLKYQQSPEELKAKLQKLYSSEERIAMLIANAVNLASNRINNYKLEAREILSNLKRFLGTHKDLVTAKDLFNTSYGE